MRTARGRRRWRSDKTPVIVLDVVVEEVVVERRLIREILVR